jgi:hypothetical protein
MTADPAASTAIPQAVFIFSAPLSYRYRFTTISTVSP